MSMDPHSVQPLEARLLYTATPAKPKVFPLQAYSGALVGVFTSDTPFQVVGGDAGSLTLQITNRKKARQYGTVDISFVLTKGSASASKFSPALGEVRNYMVDLKYKQSMTIKKSIVWSSTALSGDYTVAASIDPGGSIVAGKAFGSSVPGATVYLQKAVTDLFISNFSVTSTINRTTGNTVLSFVLNVRNGGTATARGDVPITIYAAHFDQASPDDVALKTTTLKKLVLPKNTTRTVTMTVTVPDGDVLPPDIYFLRISLDTSQLGTEASSTNDSVFSRKAIELN